MPKGVYIAASAMHVEAQALDITARNLAHTQTTGYRREAFLRTGFAEALAQRGRNGPISGDGGAGVLANGSYTVHNPGLREATGAPLDVAIEGEGFFRVTDPQGRTLLTRAGNFSTDTKGRLVTADGALVQGQGGPITIPPDIEKIEIDQTGRVSVLTNAGGVRRDAVVDQLRVVKVASPSTMTTVNGQYFDPGQQRQEDATGQVRQGYLEKSNVEPIGELVEMIAIQRRYDAAQRSLRETMQTGGQFSELLRGNG